MVEQHNVLTLSGATAQNFLPGLCAAFGTGSPIGAPPPWSCRHARRGFVRNPAPCRIALVDAAFQLRPRGRTFRTFPSKPRIGHRNRRFTRHSLAVDTGFHPLVGANGKHPSGLHRPSPIARRPRICRAARFAWTSRGLIFRFIGLPWGKARGFIFTQNTCSIKSFISASTTSW